MVYCGKISGACLPCRTARRKCDQKRPGCTQCIRRNIDCLGYRDASAINIRDQSEAVIARQKQRSKQTERTDREAEAPSVLDTNGLQSRQLNRPSHSRTVIETSNQLVLLKPITPELEHQAICYFQRNYVCLNVGGNCDATFYDLTDLYSPGLTATAFHDAIMCIGMAGIAKLKGSTDLMVESHKRHSSCLNTLKTALGSPMHAKNDDTLRVVMLMTLFEFITCTTPRAIKNWNHHVSGAVALLEHRGEAQLYSVTGRRMFGYLRQQIVPHCLQQKLPIPTTLIKMSEKMSTLRTPSETSEIPSDEFFYISARLCSINSEISNTTITALEALTSLHALSEDAKLFTTTLSLDPEFQYETTTIPFSHPWVYGHTYDRYKNLWIPHTFNTIRTTRIIILHTLHNLISEISLTTPWPNMIPSRTVLKSSCQSTIQSLTREICATIPSFLGHPTSAHTPIFGMEEIPKAVCGQALIWPLFVVGIVQFAPMEMREWVRSQLHRIDREVGLRQALFMSKALEMKRTIPVGMGHIGEWVGDMEEDETKRLWEHGAGLLLVEQEDTGRDREGEGSGGVEGVLYG